MDRIKRFERLARSERNKRSIFELRIGTIQRTLSEHRQSHMALESILEEVDSVGLLVRSASLKWFSQSTLKIEESQLAVTALQRQLLAAKSREEALTDRADSLRRADERRLMERDTLELALLMNQVSRKRSVLK